MTTPAYCPRCGTARPAEAAFCGVCGQAFDASPAPVIGTPPMASTTPALLAGLAWLVAAALGAYLAYQQWTVAQLLADSDLQVTAAWNALAAIVTLYFGARIIASPSRSLLNNSAAWAALSVLLGVVQATSGVADIFVWAIIAAAAAGVLSFVARESVPATAEVPTAPKSPSRFGLAEVLVIGAILLAIAVGGVLLTGQFSATAPNVAQAPTANTPPAGQIWFANTFDPTTLEPKGRIYSVKATEGFAVVGRLPKAVDASSLNVRMYFDGTLIATNQFNATGQGDTWAWSSSALLAAGDWTFQFTDLGGNILATGSITVTE